MADAQLEAKRRLWAVSAKEQLAPVVEAAHGLRCAFEHGSVGPAPHGPDPAAGVVDACASLSRWLVDSEAPRGLRRAGAELGAVAGVYRNAALAFRSLTGSDDGGEQPRVAACAALLDQGDDHVETFAVILAKKVGS